MFAVAADRRREIAGAILLALTIFLFLSLATDGYQGETRRSLSDLASVPNDMGRVGAITAGLLYIFVGQAAHAIYFITCVWGLMLVCHRPLDRMASRMAGLVLLTASIAGLLHTDFAADTASGFPGGALGAFASQLIVPLFGVIGSNVVAITLAIIGILLATEFLFVRMAYGGLNTFGLTVQTLGETHYRLAHWLRQIQLQRAERKSLREQRKQEAKAEREKIDELVTFVDDVVEEERKKPSDLSRMRIKQKIDRSSTVDDASDDDFDSEALDEMLMGRFERIAGLETPSDIELPANADSPREPVQVDWVQDDFPAEQPSGLPEDTPLPIEEDERYEPAPPDPRPSVKAANGAILRRRTYEDELPPDYQYPKRYTAPPLDMLDPAPQYEFGDLTAALQSKGLLLEETLQTFGIEARVTDITRGPTITRFELEPAPGIKVSRFISLADDLALALKAHRVRVEAPIPGKGRVGIEVPNDFREDVVIRELLESPSFKRHQGRLTLALGKDIGGEVMTADLAAMPHLLVAGATGAGKTVCVKTIMASLLFTKSPDEMQLMLIDPKMVELSIFNDIPHLITPVVIDPKKAATSLNWLINEMEERYRLFAELRVRNIEVYNQSVENGEIEVEGDEGEENESVSVIRKLPYIVCIIDELADLMMMARAEVEDAIARLAQLARAVGIHLIIATQRPSVDVLTGVIKANFPARISFQVSSRVDSRCILDEIGAERLIGRGDLLFLPAGQSKPARVQGAFVSDDEMNRLIGYLKTQAPPQYRDEIENWGKSQSETELPDDEHDELLEDAIQVVVSTGQASISMVQRKLRVGYTRAARLIDMMERRGIIGPHVGSKAREILVPVQGDDNEVA